MIKLKSRIEESCSLESKYCYKNTNVLINKLGIEDEKRLEYIEGSITTYNLSKLHLKRIKGNFDIEHYLAIHHFLFKDLYAFAGEIRDENMKKDNSPFCRPEYIYNYLKYTLDEMRIKSVNLTNEEELVEFLAYYYSEINAIHPFREGNGRTEREFFREYVDELNQKISFGYYELNYSLWNKDDHKKLIMGCILSITNGDINLLKDVFSKALVNLNKEKEIIKQL